MKPSRAVRAILWTAVAVLPFSAVAEGITGRLMVGERPAAGVTVAALPAESSRQEALREARRESAPPGAAATTTLADGTFSIQLPVSAVARGYRLRASGGGIVAGFLPGTWDAGETADAGDLFASEGKPLTGRVLLPDGVRPEEIELRLEPAADSREGLAPETVTARPASDGSFSFAAAHPTSNTIVVRGEGWAAGPLPGRKAGPLARPIPLRAVPIVAGMVRKKDGTPAGGVLVKVRDDGPWTVTDAAGAFRLTASSGSRLLADGGDDGFAEATLRDGTMVTMTLGSGATIAGRVVDRASGKGLPRLRLAVDGEGRPVAIRTAADGSYRLAGLPPGRYSVEPADPRFVPLRKGPSAVAAGGTLKVDLVLTTGAAIAGKVVDEKGAPVAGARGTLSPATLAGLRFTAGVRPFVTGQDGSFRARGLEPGENLRLTFRHPDHEEGSLGGLSLLPGSSRSGLEVLLRSAPGIAGTVRDENGAPLAGVDVVVARTPDASAIGYGALSNLVRSYTTFPPCATGLDGRFEVRGLPPGRYTATASRPGLARESRTPIAVERGLRPPTVDFVLRPGAAISGRVRYPDGTPVPGAIVVASARTVGNAASDYITGEPTGLDGSFTLPTLRAGVPYDLDIQENRLSGAPKLRAVPSPSQEVEIVLPAPGKIAGTVVDATTREPIPDFQVWFDRDRSSSLAQFVAPPSARQGRQGQRGIGFGDRMAVRSDDGAFLLEEVQPGTWEVNVEATGYQPSRTGGVVVADGTTPSPLRIALSRGATLKGSAVDARTGKPIPDLRIALSPSGGTSPGWLSREEGMRGTDADGLFEIAGLAPGRYTVTGSRSAYAVASQGVEVGPDGGSVKLSLSSGNSVSGLVVDEARQPVPGAAVAMTGSGSGATDEGTLSDQSGRFRFDHVAAGRWTVVAARQREVAKPVAVVVSDGKRPDDVVVAFGATATLRGTVTGLSPSDAERVSISYRAVGLAGNTRPGPDGRFEVTGLGEGTVGVSAWQSTGPGSTGRNVTRNVVIAPGQAEVDVELPFLPGSEVTGTVTRAGRPVAGAFVYATGRGGAGGVTNTLTEDDGTYRIADLQPGSYSFSARISQIDPASPVKFVEIPGASVVDLAIPTKRIAGTVVDAASGSPIAEATVRATPSAPAYVGSRSVTTDSAGSFSIEDLDGTDWTVQASRSGWKFDPKTAALGSDDAVEVRLPGTKADALAFRAVDGILGFPLRSIVARARRGNATAYYGTVALDSDGRGEVPSLEGGTYALVVRADGYAPLLLDRVAVPSAPVDLRLTPGGTVEIHVGPETLAKKDARGKISSIQKGPYPVDRQEDGRVTISGPLVRLDRIAPDFYSLKLDGGALRTFTVREGETVCVDLP